MYKLLQGDCLDLMKNIPDKSIDMILCDLPYGTTKNKWDCMIPFESLWKAYSKIIKDKNIFELGNFYARYYDEFKLKTNCHEEIYNTIVIICFHVL